MEPPKKETQKPKDNIQAVSRSGGIYGRGNVQKEPIIAITRYFLSSPEVLRLQ